MLRLERSFREIILLGREEEQNKNACSSCLPLCRSRRRCRRRMCFDAARLREAVFTPARYSLATGCGLLLGCYTALLCPVVTDVSECSTLSAILQNTLSAAAAPASRRFVRTNFWHYNFLFRRDYLLVSETSRPALGPIQWTTGVFSVWGGA